MLISDKEIRVIGALMEKSITTPENYPLTANSLQSACNQKSNRTPVMEMDMKELNSTLFSLLEKKLIEKVYNIGKTIRYREDFSRRYGFDEQQAALIGVMFLRGYQTAGELKQRTARLAEFESLQEVESVLDGLINDPQGPYVEKKHEPGQKGFRYNHCFLEDEVEKKKEGSVLLKTSTDNQRFLELEEEVARLRLIIDDLQERIAILESNI